MSVKIVTDSTCDLPPALIAENEITVLPLYINIGNQGYRDGVDMSREEFYSGLADFSHHPTTAAPSPDTFQKTYEQLAAEGATEILSIHISKSLSAVVDVATLAAQSTTTVPVTVFDSGQLSLGAGYLVLEAAKLAKMGKTAAEIVTTLTEKGKRIYVFAALNTLEFLKRSGRMNFALATLGSLLRLKPVLKMNSGQPTSERIRTREKAIQRIIHLVESLGPLERIDLVHTNAPQDAELLRQRVAHFFETTPISVNVTPVLGAHLGPDVVGFACIAKA